MLIYLSLFDPPYTTKYWIFLMGTMIVYFIYCIIVAPIAFLVSVILNHYYILNLFTIFYQYFHYGYALSFIYQLFACNKHSRSMGENI